MFSKSDLLEMANTKMPYGKYAGYYLVDLPEPYVIWLGNQGFANNQLGKLLAITLEVKINGLESVIRPLIHND